MNSEERPAISRTAYRRTNNILRSPTLSKHILHFFRAVDPSLISCLLCQNNGASLDGKLRFPAVCEKLQRNSMKAVCDNFAPSKAYFVVAVPYSQPDLR